MSLSSLSTSQELLKLRAGFDKLEHVGAVKMVKTHSRKLTIAFGGAAMAGKATKEQHEP